MKKIRIGKDIVLKWTLFSSQDEQFPLEGEDLKLFLKTPYLLDKELKFSVEGNILQSTFKGVDQEILGIYSLTLWLNYGKDNQSVLDCCDAFELVSATCEENKDEGKLQTETLDIEGCFDTGVRGLSAYEIALKNGFVGSEEEWLLSLKGKSFTYSDFTPEQIKELQKPASDAADLANKAAQKAESAIANIPVSLEVLEQIND